MLRRNFVRCASRHLVFTRADAETAARDPDTYWANAATKVDFFSPYKRVSPTPESLVDSGGQWFAGGTLNVCHNACDRHAAATPNKTAILFESTVRRAGDATAEKSGDIFTTSRGISYEELLANVAAYARVLRDEFGVRAGDAVTIFMPNAPETVFAILACARLGAPFNPVFGGFAAPELAKRVADAQSRVVLTASGAVEGLSGRVINYKHIVDEAVAHLPNPDLVRHVGVIERRSAVPREAIVPHFTPRRDAMLCDLAHAAMSRPRVPCAPVPSEHPLYALYTSGSTGLPKAIVRDTAGTAVSLVTTFGSIYGLSANDTALVMSDVGWIVGMNYTVLAPLLSGATTVLYEGKPIIASRDDVARAASPFFRLVEKHRPGMLFTAPTAMRAIKAIDAAGTAAARHDLSSLHAVYLAGERTDTDTLRWVRETLFRNAVPVVDHFWQTETGSAIVSAPREPRAFCGARGAASIVGAATEGSSDWDLEDGAIATQDGSAGIGAPGYQVELAPSSSATADDSDMRELLVKLPLPPGAMSGIWRRPAAMRETYLTAYPGYFRTLDVGTIDKNGFVTVHGRADDVINVAAHRLSTSQLENCIASHSRVAEVAVIGVPDALRGERPVGIVVLKKIGGGGNAKCDDADALNKELQDLVRETVGHIAVITVVHVAALPKTRSGKILRRTLRDIATRRVPVAVPPTIEDAAVVPQLWREMHGGEEMPK